MEKRGEGTIEPGVTAGEDDVNLHGGKGQIPPSFIPVVMLLWCKKKRKVLFVIGGKDQ